MSMLLHTCLVMRRSGPFFLTFPPLVWHDSEVLLVNSELQAKAACFSIPVSFLPVRSIVLSTKTKITHGFYLQGLHE